MRPGPMLLRISTSCALLAVLSGSASAESTGDSAVPRIELSTRLSTVDSAKEAVKEIHAAFPRLRAQQLSLKLRDDLESHRLGTRTLRFNQLHRGVPVMGRWATLTAGAGGVTRVARSELGALPQDLTPSLGMTPARELAERAAAVRYQAKPELRIVSAGREMRLSWVFRPRSLKSWGYAPITTVDAHTGEILSVVNAVRFDRLADIYPTNPVQSPEAEQVVLEALPEGGTVLTDDLLSVHNCIDHGTIGDMFQGDEHVCEPEQTAVADENGDFTAYQHTDDQAEEDAYAEVSAYYHLRRAYDAFQGWGLPLLDAVPLPAVVNLRIANPSNPGSTKLPLVPFDNAFFLPMGARSSIWFGQGETQDFALDGDVVYHEFGHGAVDRAAGLSFEMQFDEQGTTPTAGSLHEGLADYFSSAIAGDPNVGEYASQAFGKTAIRSVANDHTCPESLVGEAHYDSTHFSGALWSVREALGDEVKRSALDAAIVGALMRLPRSDPTYAEVALLIAEVASEVEVLGDAAAALLSDEFEARGILPGCLRSLALTPGEPYVGREVSGGNHFFLAGKNELRARRISFVPSALQFHTEVNPSETHVRVSGLTAEVPERPPMVTRGTSYMPVLLVKFAAADEPITFHEFPNLDPGVSLSEIFQLNGAFELDVAIPMGATHVHVMLANSGDKQGLAGGLTLRSHSDGPLPPPEEPEPEEAPPGSSSVGDAAESGDGQEEPIVAIADPPGPGVVTREGGCTVDSGAGNRGNARHWALVAASVLPLCWWRRRRAPAAK